MKALPPEGKLSPHSSSAEKVSGRVFYCLNNVEHPERIPEHPERIPPPPPRGSPTESRSFGCQRPQLTLKKVRWYSCRWKESLKRILEKNPWKNPENRSINSNENLKLSSTTNAHAHLTLIELIVINFYEISKFEWINFKAVKSSTKFFFQIFKLSNI